MVQKRVRDLIYSNKGLDQACVQDWFYTNKYIHHYLSLNTLSRPALIWIPALSQAIMVYFTCELSFYNNMY